MRKLFYTIPSSIGSLLPMTKDLKKIITTARYAATEAGSVILSLFNKAQVHYKDLNDPVTQADIDAQEKITGIIKEQFPSHQFLNEEDTREQDYDSDHLWIIDPLDGTNNYIGGIPHFGVSVAYAEKGVLKAGVVYDPVRDEMFYADSGGAYLNEKPIRVTTTETLKGAVVATGFSTDRGEPVEKTCDIVKMLLKNDIRAFRRMGSAALDLCWVACGRLDAYFEYSLHTWDFAGGAHIVKQAGGECVSSQGTELRLDSSGVIASNSVLFDAFKRKTAWKK
ncbi:MAG: inositol monophosphatase [Chitinivibrionales bacterium]|nr:inositol monophosphatase [Chitinivibrionales bacterium]